MTNYGTLNHRTIEKTDYYSLIRSDARGLRKQPAGYTVRVPEWGWHAGRHKRGIETDRYHARHLDSVLYRPPRSVRPHLPTDYEDDYED